MSISSSPVFSGCVNQSPLKVDIVRRNESVTWPNVKKVSSAQSVTDQALATLGLESYGLRQLQHAMHFDQELAEQRPKESMMTYIRIRFLLQVATGAP